MNTVPQRVQIAAKMITYGLDYDAEITRIIALDAALRWIWRIGNG